MREVPDAIKGYVDRPEPGRAASSYLSPVGVVAVAEVLMAELHRPQSVEGTRLPAQQPPHPEKTPGESK